MLCKSVRILDCNDKVLAESELPEGIFLMQDATAVNAEPITLPVIKSGEPARVAFVDADGNTLSDCRWVSEAQQMRRLWAYDTVIFRPGNLTIALDGDDKTRMFERDADDLYLQANNAIGVRHGA